MALDRGGETLGQRLARRTLGIAELAPILDDALSALTVRHARKLIHGAITPDQLFIQHLALADRPRTRLLEPEPRPTPDRGMETDLRAFETSLGSFAYLAPEQVRGSRTVDASADLYALGAVTFRALTGRIPFEATNALTLIALKLDRDPPTLEQASGASWPPAVERFVARMMARVRAERFPSAAAALAALRALTLS